MNKDEIISKAAQLGFEYEKKYHGCSQCTVAAVQDALGIRNDLVFKAAGGLVAGIGRLCDGVCGGYSGGVIVMSMFFSRCRSKFDNDREMKNTSYKMACLLHKLFDQKYGSVICREIHMELFGRTFDFCNPKDIEIFENMGAHKDKCTGVVRDASKWATSIILDEMEERGLTPLDFKHLEYIEK